MGVKNSARSFWFAGMRHPSLFLPACLIVALFIMTVALEFLFPTTPKVSAWRSFWHVIWDGKTPTELTFLERYPYRFVAIALGSVASVWVCATAHLAKKRAGNNVGMGFWVAFGDETLKTFSPRHDFRSRDWNAKDARLAIKELERKIEKMKNEK